MKSRKSNKIKYSHQPWMIGDSMEKTSIFSLCNPLLKSVRDRYHLDVEQLRGERQRNLPPPPSTIPSTEEVRKLVNLTIDNWLERHGGEAVQGKITDKLRTQIVDLAESFCSRMDEKEQEFQNQMRDKDYQRDLQVDMMEKQITLQESQNFVEFHHLQQLFDKNDRLEREVSKLNQYRQQYDHLLAYLQFFFGAPIGPFSMHRLYAKDKHELEQLRAQELKLRETLKRKQDHFDWSFIQMRRCMDKEVEELKQSPLFNRDQTFFVGFFERMNRAWGMRPNHNNNNPMTPEWKQEFTTEDARKRTSTQSLNEQYNELLKQQFVLELERRQLARVEEDMEKKQKWVKTLESMLKKYKPQDAFVILAAKLDQVNQSITKLAAQNAQCERHQQECIEKLEKALAEFKMDPERTYQPRIYKEENVQSVLRQLHQEPDQNHQLHLPEPLSAPLVSIPPLPIVPHIPPSVLVSVPPTSTQTSVSQEQTNKKQRMTETYVMEPALTGF